MIATEAEVTEALEMASTSQLAKELLSRSTFCGILVVYPKEMKAITGAIVDLSEIMAVWRNMTPRQAVDNLHRAMHGILEQIAKGEDE